MSRATLAIVIPALLGVTACGAPERITPAVPLYDDLGDHHHDITTDEALAQQYFDQGLRLYYAFNHAEAIRSFREAQRIDPTCAMCWWGEALSWGPNINLPMDDVSGRAAYAAVSRAVALRDHASPGERDLIDALAVRYRSDPPTDRADLDRAYADAMASVASRYPDDLDASVLYAESVMDLRPWDYWTDDGRLQPGMEAALGRLEEVQVEDPSHPGACHFFIHAMEEVHPERAVPCAERLAALMPGAGHVVHMPGHIYIRVGRYLDAVEANEHAVHADETYIRDGRPGTTTYTAGYYPHNYDFMAFAAMMIGRSAEATRAADQVAELIPPEMFGAPGMDFLQHWSIRPLLVRVRFARWDEILDAPEPPTGRPHARAIWHYARGRAFVGGGDVVRATEELDRLRVAAGEAGRSGARMEFNLSASLLGIAERVLTGRIEAASGHRDEAVHALSEAVAGEDALVYGEPPEWTVPARQDLGAVLLDAGRPAEAEQAFREDLDRFPRNGWSLHGLEMSLRSQGRAAEADSVMAEFRTVWATADMAPEL